MSEKDWGISKSLNYSGVNFPVSKKDYNKIEVLNKLCINVFSYKIRLFTLYIFLIKVLRIVWIYY